jgi:exosortase
MRDEDVPTPSQFKKNTAALREPWYLNRNRIFLLFNVVFVSAFFSPLRDLVQTSLRSDYDTYIPFIPFITAYLIYMEKKNIFSYTDFSPVVGLPVASIGILLLFIARNQETLLENRDYLAIMTLSLVMFWIGAFTFFYGVRSLRAAAFPLLFLLFAVPIPNSALERTIFILQAGSAEVAYRLLQATGMPIVRDGFVFHLSKLDIEVAPQCSGIRSSLSLLITGVLAAYFFLRTGWARTLLMASIIPIAILKNGFRIAVLSSLAIYWDEKILASDLHRKGGLVFFILALLLAGGVIMLLRKMETRKTAAEDVK